MAKSIDIRCPQCGRLYHADESHLGKSIRCVQCGKILLLIVGEPPTAEQRCDRQVPEVQPSPQTRDSESELFSKSSAIPHLTYQIHFIFRLGYKELNRPQKYAFVLATFAFLMTALRPPFIFGQRSTIRLALVT